MRISYHKDTDSLYIHLRDTPTDESEEVAEDTVLHFDENGNVTGIEIYSEAASRVDLSKLEVSGLEFANRVEEHFENVCSHHQTTKASDYREGL